MRQSKDAVLVVARRIPGSVSSPEVVQKRSLPTSGKPFKATTAAGTREQLSLRWTRRTRRRKARTWKAPDVASWSDLGLMRAH